MSFAPFRFSYSALAQPFGHLVFRATWFVLFFTLIATSFSSISWAQESGYLLDSNDVISISVYGEDDLSFEEMRIGDSGVITYPLLGEVKAAGNTINGLETAIRSGLIEGEFLIDPRVTITIVTYRPFYIDGEVEDPGSYPYEPGLTLRRAVSIAGGFTERASRSNVTIHSAEDEDAEPRTTDSLDVEIQPGDVITVAQRFF